MSSYAFEIGLGQRFQFGKNWSNFLSLINEERIARAEGSLKLWLECDSLENKSFLDIGSGSGLFSLAARRLGARVHSFDYDPESVACTAELRQRYFLNDSHWTIEQGSVLDVDYLRRLGLFDIVYTWGVLHHTGKMWQALDNAQIPLPLGGRLIIALYNDAGTQSTRWRWIKKTYNSLPRLLRLPFLLAVSAPSEAKAALRALWALRPQQYVQSWTQYDPLRGMSHWHDLIDWVGGYPYEVAKPEEVFDFYRARGFTLIRLKAGGVGLGCNEFVFEKRHLNGMIP